MASAVIHKKPVVSIIIPCRNERNHITRTLDSLLTQKKLDAEMEIIVADGLSDDGTYEVLEDYAKVHPEVIVLVNSRKAVPYALSILLEKARGDFIMRADAHSVFPPDYLATIVPYLREQRADNVGGVIECAPGADTIEAKAIASSLNSKFGVSISFRTLTGDRAVEVETVPFGAWRADHFKKYGPFDENFLRAQDLEHNIRVRKMGGKILCLPWLKVIYYARDTFEKFKRMAFQYGYWKIPVKEKHRTIFSVRQYVPPLFVIGTLLSIPLGIFLSPVFFVLPGSYLITDFVVSLYRARLDGNLSAFYLYMYAFGLFHVYYGLGYLRGYWDVYIKKKFGFSEITR